VGVFVGGGVGYVVGVGGAAAVVPQVHPRAATR
jgi:hypothetical protein